MTDVENVISNLQIIHTWAEFARERDLQFFTPKHLRDIAEWTDDALELLKEQEEQKQKWLQSIADNQLANAPMDGCCLEQWNYQKGVYDGLQMAWDILMEGR